MPVSTGSVRTREKRSAPRDKGHDRDDIRRQSRPVNDARFSTLSLLPSFLGKKNNDKSFQKKKKNTMAAILPMPPSSPVSSGSRNARADSSVSMMAHGVCCSLLTVRRRPSRQASRERESVLLSFSDVQRLFFSRGPYGFGEEFLYERWI